MPRVPTRYQQRHEQGIWKTHPIQKESDPSTLRLIGELRKEIEREGIKVFIGEIFKGDISVDNQTISRQQIISLIDTNSRFRGLISSNWRKEEPHTHEWIPCTYLCHILKRALVADDFRFFYLADAMRTPTRSLIFKPPAVNPIKVYDPNNGNPLVVLNAHPGGLRFDGSSHPFNSYTFQPNFNPFVSSGSNEFHGAIIQALGQSGNIDQLIANLRGIFQAHCWDGKFPVNGYAKTDIWPFYIQGDGTAVDSLNKFTQFHKRIKNEYRAVDTQFSPTGDFGEITGYNRSGPVYWI